MKRFCFKWAKLALSDCSVEYQRLVTLGTKFARIEITDYSDLKRMDGNLTTKGAEIRADALTAIKWVEEIEANLTSSINGLRSIILPEGNSAFCGLLRNWEIPRCLDDYNNTERKLRSALQDLTEKHSAITHSIARMQRDLNWALADKLEGQIAKAMCKTEYPFGVY